MMTREQRAKQFLPFDAMKGLGEALKAREERHSRTAKKIMSEEEEERLAYSLSRIKKGMIVEIDCHCAFHDLTKRGEVAKTDPVMKYLLLDGEKIYFDDIYEIRIKEYDR